VQLLHRVHSPVIAVIVLPDLSLHLDGMHEPVAAAFRWLRMLHSGSPMSELLLSHYVMEEGKPDDEPVLIRIVDLRRLNGSFASKISYGFQLSHNRSGVLHLFQQQGSFLGGEAGVCAILLPNATGTFLKTALVAPISSATIASFFHAEYSSFGPLLELSILRTQLTASVRTLLLA